jgi:hypothetical protein
MRRISAVPVLVATLAACATVGESSAPAAPPSFREVRSLVLVRAAYERVGRGRDPLDGLDESLRARGYATRVVELGASGKPAQPALERLFLQLESRAGAPRGERFGTLPFAEAGAATGAVVIDLGVDAVATYHRLEGRRPLGSVASEPMLPGSALPGPQVVPERGPLGAIVVVDRRGHVATFPWGATSALDDPSVPVNAAEAIDLVLRTLAGQAPDDER